MGNNSKHNKKTTLLDSMIESRGQRAKLKTIEDTNTLLIKLEVSIGTDVIGSEVSDIIEVEMTNKEYIEDKTRDELFNEAYQEWMFNKLNNYMLYKEIK